MIKKVTGFVSEVKTEMSKVTWSTREELIHATMIVLAVMFFLAVYIGVADFVLALFMRIVIRG